MTPEEETALRGTITNLMAIVENTAKGLQLATETIIEQDRRIRSLEHIVKRKEGKPVVLNAIGERAN